MAKNTDSSIKLLVLYDILLKTTDKVVFDDRYVCFLCLAAKNMR